MGEPQLEPVNDDRHETSSEKMDRNWGELLQELRVTQTGAQIIVGFLLTLPFQQRFEMLDDVQRGTYLVLVLLAMLATALIVAPVSVHRVLFRRGMKPALVTAGDRLARAGLAVLALVLTGCTFLLFDVVWSRTVATVAAGAVGVTLLTFWLVIPLILVRRAPD